jgi:hypothetical protein
MWKMNRNVFLALSVFLFCCTRAGAEDDPDPGLKAGALRAACNPPATNSQAEKDAGDQVCQAYLRGVADGLFMHGLVQHSGTPLCLPEDGPVSPAEARDEFEDYLAGHPEVANRSAGVAVAFAIIAAHPCE